jgi:hypothetical protein
VRGGVGQFRSQITSAEPGERNIQRDSREKLLKIEM